MEKFTVYKKERWQLQPKTRLLPFIDLDEDKEELEQNEIVIDDVLED